MAPKPAISKKDKAKEELVEDLEKSWATINRMKTIINRQEKLLERRGLARRPGRARNRA